VSPHTTGLTQQLSSFLGPQLGGNPAQLGPGQEPETQEDAHAG
jgi:hypothetical protein